MFPSLLPDNAICLLLVERSGEDAGENAEGNDGAICCSGNFPGNGLANNGCEKTLMIPKVQRMVTT
jgi:hypothetical protein